MKISRNELRRMILEAVLREQDNSSTTAAGARRNTSNPAISGQIETAVKEILDKAVGDKAYNAIIKIGKNSIDIDKEAGQKIDKEIFKSDKKLSSLREKLKTLDRVFVTYSKMNSEKSNKIQTNGQKQPAPAAASPQPASTETLDKKEKIKQVQMLINRILYNQDSEEGLITDGIWGKETDKYLNKVFQKFYLTDPNEKKSWSSLSSEVGEKPTLSGLLNYLTKIEKEKPTKTNESKNTYGKSHATLIRERYWGRY